MRDLLKIVILFLSFVSTHVFAQLDLELDSDDNHVITYEVVEDTIQIQIEVLNDFILDLDSNGNLESNDDFVYVMIDRNSNDAIDLGSSTDLFFTYDSSKTNGICAGYISTPQDLSPCSPSGSRAIVKIRSTATSSTPHVVYDFFIPTNELEFGGKEALCGQVSIKIHSAENAVSASATFPEQIDDELYYVNPSNTIKLFPEATILLPSGESAPEGGSVAVCVGDRLELNSDYPEDEYEWFDENAPSFSFSQNTYALVKNIKTTYYFVELKDTNNPFCYYTDTVFVNLQDESICNGAYKFPNVVTPNADGINDIFELILGAEDLDDWDWTGARLKIYNRWGLSVYQSSKDLPGRPYWDCREETGSYVPSGTYFYTFNLPNSSTVINGFFTVFSDR